MICMEHMRYMTLKITALVVNYDISNTIVLEMP